MNAYTTKEYTCYYAKVLSEDIVTPLDILTDMYFDSLFSERDVETEKKVVCEEINMYEDTARKTSSATFCPRRFSKESRSKIPF